MSDDRGVTLQDYLRSRRAEIEDALRRFLSRPAHGHTHIVDAMAYSLFAGGKRFRPVLTLATADALSGGSAEARRRAMPAACAIEMIHTYSLIHDDLPAMDDDTLRRGKPTNHVVYGEGMAILAGDGLHAEAFGLLAREPVSADDTDLAARKLAVIQAVADAAGSGGMVGGQAIDLLAAGHGHDAQRLTPDGLRTMHACKTGALIRASAAVGAIMAGGTKAHVAAIDTYATQLGLAFQIIDDILDVEATSAEMGKTVGKDAAANKPTYPMFFGLDQSRQLARTATDHALAALDGIGLADSRLAEIAEWLVSRTS
jgi:geranylgeranyl diphosphate synthase, type II